MMSDKEDLTNFHIASNGYKRLFDDSEAEAVSNGIIASNTVVSVRREEQITTLYGRNLKENKIKISLSQDQIVKAFNGIAGSGIKRSQSINIQKTIYSPNVFGFSRGQSVDIHRRNSLRKPSQIPVKVSESTKFGSASTSLVMNNRNTENKSSRDLIVSDCSVSNSERVKVLRKRNVSNACSSRAAADTNVCVSSLPYIKATVDSNDRSNQNVENTNFLSDQYNCKLCLNTLRDPRVLDCLHRFCLECLFDNELPSKANTGKVNLVLGHCSRENSEMDIGGSNSKLDNSQSTDLSAETICKPAKSTFRAISANHIRKIITSTIKQRPNERKNLLSPQVKHRVSTVTEKCKIVIKCPICSQRTEILIGGISRLPKDFLLQRQIQNELCKLEELKLANIFCSLCYDEIEAVSHCTNCRLSLCKICKEAHLRQRATSKHNVVNIIDLKNQSNNVESKLLSQTKSILKCFIHPTQELKLYCITCDQVACHNCTILLHKGHKFEPMLKATKHCLKLLKESLERNHKFFDYVNDSISKLAGSGKKINQRADIIQNEIEQFLKEYFEALEVHKETLLRQIAKAKETKHLSIMEQREYLEKRSLEANEANLFADNLLKNGTDMEILVFAGTLQRRFDHCQKSKTSIDPKIPDSFRFLPEIRAPATQAQHNIPMYGIIATQVADPKYCTMEMDEPIVLRIHRRAELRILSKDCDDRPLCHGGIMLNVNVIYKDAPTKEVAPQVSDKRDGTYIIAFTPDAVGLMSVSIKVQDKDIKESPFEISVRALRSHSGVFHCCTFCSSKGSKAITCACGSKMSGGYKGCGHGHDEHPGRRHWSCCASVLETSECTATNSFR